MGIFLGVISHLMFFFLFGCGWLWSPHVVPSCPLCLSKFELLQVVIEVNPVLCGFAVLRDYEGCIVDVENSPPPINQENVEKTGESNYPLVN